MNFRVLDAGDTALTIEFGERIDRRLLAAVAAADDALTRARVSGELAGIVETVPTFRSLMRASMILCSLSAGRNRRPAIRAAIGSQGLHGELTGGAASGNCRSATATRSSACGPDLERLAEACTKLSPDEVIGLHSSATQCSIVYMLGFLPGFPVHGRPAAGARTCRDATNPRLRVPAGQPSPSAMPA
jgi:inhibitor of KinA